MPLPALVSIREKKRSVTSFKGYCHDERAGADRFYDMQNMSGEAFPLLSVRERRAELASLTKPNGLCAHGALLYADGTNLYYNGALVGNVSDSPKQFVRIGAAVLIWPDKLKFDTLSGTLTPLGASYSSTGSVSFSLCNLQGEDYGVYSTGTTAPADPDGGDLWLDTGVTPNVLKRYSSVSGMWTSLSASYIKIAHTGIGAAFSAYDGVTISGATAAAINGSAVLYAVSADWLLIAGTLDQSFTQTAALHISREIPDFDFLCERDNRVWGCSNARREIACCKLGDPGNWNCYMGISTDSYTLCVGSGGDFTACCAYGGSVLFFKEDRIMKLLGTKPENFQLNSVLCHGVAAGSSKSLVQTDGALYYHARGGICAYGGALPELVGQDLGEPLFDAVGGAAYERYYVSAKNAQNVWRLFVYDLRTGLWYKEDDAQALGFAAHEGEGYMLKKSGTGAKLLALRAAGAGTAETALPWYFETGELIEAGYARAKRLLLRFEAAAETRLALYLSYDGGGFEFAGQMDAERKRPVLVPLKLRRCDSLRLRVTGEGAMRLHALKLIFENGGEY